MDSSNASFDLEMRHMFQNNLQRPHHQINKVINKHQKHKSQIEKERNGNFQTSNMFKDHTNASQRLLNGIHQHQSGNEDENKVTNKQTHHHHKYQSYSINREASQVTLKPNLNYQSCIQGNSHKNQQQQSHFADITTQFSNSQNMRENRQKSASSYQDKLQSLTLDLKNQNLCQIPESLVQKQIQQHNIHLLLDNNLISSLNKSSNLALNRVITLSLVNNKLSFIGNLWETFPNLKSLNLNQNRIISLEGIKGCIKLSKLSISNNFIADDQLNFLGNLLNLKHLNMSHNQLSQTKQLLEIIQLLKYLKHIDASENQFGECLRLNHKHSNLREIVMNDNKLQEIIIESQLSLLKHLNLSNNSISIINGLYHMGDSLENLNLYNNQITQIQGMKDVHNCFFGLKKLKILNLSDNKLYGIQEECKLQFQSIQELYLRGNKLNNYRFVNEILSSKLKVLDLGQNKILKIEAIQKQLSSIVNLSLDKNQLINLQNIELYKNLKCLKIDSNPFDQNLNILQLKYLSSLQSLSINLQGMHKMIILTQIPQIQFLDGNNISQVDRNYAQKQLLTQKGHQLDQHQQIQTLSDTLTITQHLDESKDEFKESIIKKVCLEDSNDQQEIFNEVIKLSHMKPLVKCYTKQLPIHVFTTQSDQEETKNGEEEEEQEEHTFYSLPVQQKDKQQLQLNQKYNSNIQVIDHSSLNPHHVLTANQKIHLYKNYSPAISSPQSFRLINQNQLEQFCNDSSVESLIDSLEKIKDNKIQIITHKFENKQQFPATNKPTAREHFNQLLKLTNEQFQTYQGKQTLQTLPNQYENDHLITQYGSEKYLTQETLGREQLRHCNEFEQLSNNRSQPFLQSKYNTSQDYNMGFKKRELSACTSQQNLLRNVNNYNDKNPILIQNQKDIIQYGEHEIVSSEPCINKQQSYIGSNSKNDFSGLRSNNFQRSESLNEKTDDMKKDTCQGVPSSIIQISSNLKAQELFKLIKLEQLESELNFIANKFILNSENEMLTMNENKQLLETYSQNLLDLFKNILDQIKDKVKQQNKDHQRTLSQEPCQSRSYNNLPQVKSRSASLNNNIYNYQSTTNVQETTNFEQVRVPLLELINALSFQYKQSGTVRQQNLLSRLIRDISVAINLQISTFKMGKFLFKYKEEVEHLEKTIYNSPSDMLLKSKLLQFLFEEHFYPFSNIKPLDLSLQIKSYCKLLQSKAILPGEEHPSIKNKNPPNSLIQEQLSSERGIKDYDKKQEGANCIENLRYQQNVNSSDLVNQSSVVLCKSQIQQQTQSPMISYISRQQKIRQRSQDTHSTNSNPQQLTNLNNNHMSNTPLPSIPRGGSNMGIESTRERTNLHQFQRKASADYLNCADNYLRTPSSITHLNQSSREHRQSMHTSQVSSSNAQSIGCKKNNSQQEQQQLYTEPVVEQQTSLYPVKKASTNNFQLNANIHKKGGASTPMTETIGTTISTNQQEDLQNQIINKDRQFYSIDQDIGQQVRKIDKIKKQLLTYGRYPLQPITVDQSKSTFLNEITPETASFEFKLLKQFTKYNKGRLMKALKAFNYEKMQSLNQETPSSSLQVLFYAGSIDEMSDSLQTISIIQSNFLLTSDLEQSKRSFYQQTKQINSQNNDINKRRKQFWRVVICLAKFENIKLVEENRQINQIYPRQIEEYKDKGFDAIYFKANKTYMCLSPKRCIPCYLLEYSFKD